MSRAASGTSSTTCATSSRPSRRTLDGGASYQRQLQVAAAHDGDLTAVVAHLARELREGTAPAAVE